MGSAWIATMLTVPQTRTTSVTARAAAGLPVTSKATSTPSPPVQSAVKRDTSMSGPTVVRPNDSSSATRNGFTSATATSAPRWRATSARPAPPPPPGGAAGGGGGGGARLDQRGVVVGERGRDLEQACGGHGP